MTISYNNLWKILIDKEMNKGALCSKAKISKGTMAKMTNNGKRKIIRRIVLP